MANVTTTGSRLPLIVRLVNQFGEILNRLHLRPVNLSGEHLMAVACKQTVMDALLSVFPYGCIIFTHRGGEDHRFFIQPNCHVAPGEQPQRRSHSYRFVSTRDSGDGC